MREIFEKFCTLVGVIVVTVVVLFVYAMLFAFPVMWLWNWLMPYLFGLNTITVWQALGLNLLCGLLFRGSSVSKKGNKQ